MLQQEMSGFAGFAESQSKSQTMPAGSSRGFQFQGIMRACNACMCSFAISFIGIPIAPRLVAASEPLDQTHCLASQQIGSISSGRTPLPARTSCASFVRTRSAVPSKSPRVKCKIQTTQVTETTHSTHGRAQALAPKWPPSRFQSVPLPSSSPGQQHRSA